MIKFYVDYQAVTPKPEVKTNGAVPLIGALASFQFHHATHERHTFTALDTERGLAFSQDYHKTEPGMAWHSHTWKHERDVENPGDIPSFDELERRAIETPGRCAECGGEIGIICVRADNTETCEECATPEILCRSCGKPSEDRSAMCLTCEPV